MAIIYYLTPPTQPWGAPERKPVTQAIQEHPLGRVRHSLLPRRDSRADKKPPPQCSSYWRERPTPHIPCLPKYTYIETVSWHNVEQQIDRRNQNGEPLCTIEPTLPRRIFDWVIDSLQACPYELG